MPFLEDHDKYVYPKQIQEQAKSQFYLFMVIVSVLSLLFSHFLKKTRKHVSLLRCTFFIQIIK